MATVTTAAKKTAARKTAAPKGMTSVPLDVVEKGETASQTAPESVPAVVVDSDVYVAPTGLSDGFQGNGSVPLDRLTERALKNLTELATDAVTPVEDGNTPQARKYWTAVLARYGVKVDVPAVVPDESVSV